MNYYFEEKCIYYVCFVARKQFLIAPFQGVVGPLMNVGKSVMSATAFAIIYHIYKGIPGGNINKLVAMAKVFKKVFRNIKSALSSDIR